MLASKLRRETWAHADHAAGKRMRELARTKYGCRDFVAAMNDGLEITISYWQTLLNIDPWRNDAEHLAVQEIGRNRWYSPYQIEVAEVLRVSDPRPS